jgi:hypothetical protein
MDIIPDPYVERLEDEVDRLRLLNTELVEVCKELLEMDAYTGQKVEIRERVEALIAEVKNTNK